MFNLCHDPIFVSENAAVGSVVAIIEATDADIGDNGAIRFEMLTQSAAFSINRVTGELVSTIVFDTENTATNYELTLRLTDLGDPALSTITPDSEQCSNFVRLPSPPPAAFPAARSLAHSLKP